MKKYANKLYDFTPDYIFGRILLAIVLGVTIATGIVFMRSANAINNHPYEDFMVFDDMAQYMQHPKMGHGKTFDEGDME